MGGSAWVTLATNDSYSLGALVLAHSLKQTGTAHRLAVLVTPGVTNSMRQKLAGVFDLVEEVNVLDSKDEANLRLLKRPELGITFTKLHCWRLTQFDKCVFLDADTLVLKNADELFDREEFSAAPDVGWPDCFNSGVFVYRPSNETYDKLVQFALAKGSFDGGDQGLLNLYFNDWAHKDISRHLPFIYNMCSTACYSYLPAFKQFGTDVKIVHFIGTTKPWLQYFNTESKQVQPGGDMQHLQQVLQTWWEIFCNVVHSNLTAEMSAPPQAIAHALTAADHSDVWDPWEDYVSDGGSHDEATQFESHNTNALPQSEPSISLIPSMPSSCTETATCQLEPLTLSDPLSLSILAENTSIGCFKSLGPSQNAILKDVLVTETPETPLSPPQTIQVLPVEDTCNANSNSNHSSSASNISRSQSPYEFINTCITDVDDVESEPHADASGGLAGAFAQFNIGAPRSQGQSELEESLRRQSWEVGNIDYMGRDAFDKIWSKISETIAKPPEVGAKGEAVPTVAAAEEVKSEEAKVEEKPAPVKEEVKDSAPVDVKPAEVMVETIPAEVKSGETAPVTLQPEPAPESKLEEVKESTKTEIVPKSEASKLQAKLEGEALKVESASLETPKPEEVKPEVAAPIAAETPLGEETKSVAGAPEAESLKVEDVKLQVTQAVEAIVEASEGEKIKEETPKAEDPKVSKAEEINVDAPKSEQPEATTMKTEEVKQESCKTAKLKVESPELQQSQNEPPKMEEINAELGKQEILKTKEVTPGTQVEEPKTEFPKSVEVKQETSKVEDVQSEIVKTEVSKVEEVPKLEDVRTEALKEETKLEETSNPEEVKAEASKSDVPVSEVPKVDTPAIAPLEAKSETSPTLDMAKPSEQLEVDASPTPKVSSVVPVTESKDVPVECTSESSKSETSAAPVLEDAATSPEAECTKKLAVCPKSECPPKEEESSPKVECPAVPVDCPKAVCPLKTEEPCSAEYSKEVICPAAAKDCPKGECPKSEAPVSSVEAPNVIEESRKDQTLAAVPAPIPAPGLVPVATESAPVPAEPKDTPKLETSVVVPPQSEVPATPEVIAPTPPTTPVATTEAPAATGETASATVQTETGENVPVPPPRKSSGGKKPKSKK